MKTKKLLLDIEDDDEEITIGLIRLAKEVPDYQLFYHLNSINPFQFSRIDDFMYRGNYYDYCFPRFQAYDSETKVCIDLIANKSSHSNQTQISTELFSGEQETRFLLENFHDVDYLIKTTDSFDDFSLISLPENILFQIQNYTLSPDEELYQLIQYYE